MLTRVSKELIRYTRGDEVEDLTGTLYLPPDYDGSALPGLLRAYPSEYESAHSGQSAARQPLPLHPPFLGPPAVFCPVRAMRFSTTRAFRWWARARKSRTTPM